MLLFHHGSTGKQEAGTSIHMDDLMGNSVLSFMYICYGSVVVYTYIKETHTPKPMLKAFQRFTLITAVIRAVYFGVPNFVLHTVEAPRDTGEHFTMAWFLQLLWLVLYSAGNTLMVCVYGLVIYFWNQAFNRATLSGSSMPNAASAWTWYQYMTGAYVLLEVLGLALYFAMSLLQVFTFFAVLRGVVAVMVSTFFIISFCRLHSALSPNLDQQFLLANSATGTTWAVREAAEEVGRKLTSLRAVAGLCVAGQLFRLAIAVYGAVEFSTEEPVLQGYWIILFVYYTAAEIVPVAGILYIMRKPSVALARGSGARRSVDGEDGTAPGTYHALQASAKGSRPPPRQGGDGGDAPPPVAHPLPAPAGLSLGKGAATLEAGSLQVGSSSPRASPGQGRRHPSVRMGHQRGRGGSTRIPARPRSDTGGSEPTAPQ